MIILGIILGVIAISGLFFMQPYSALKSEFKQTAQELTGQTNSTEELFSEQDIAKLPVPVQKYFNHCGYLGTPKMSWKKTEFKDVPFATGVNKPTLNIDYTQYNFVEKPDRLAFIDSKMYGIPFQGFDSYKQGTGSMKGVLAKVFTLFEQKGATMDKACLVTVLAESLYVPNIALQHYITWEAIDDTHARATISAYGQNASGVFTFNEAGEVLNFTTNDRVAVDFDGKEQNIPWSAIYTGYERNEEGILQPTVLQAVWQYPEGDLLYFDGKIDSQIVQ
ncbi:MAG TPA: hypothetical protein GXX46_11460 [Peptococcaceae bacterium]|nr:hypothetical protein [Peptococcaceae bacterium]